MFKWIWNKKAQNTAEYAILIGLVVATAIGIQTYVKRGLMGRVRNAVDHSPAPGDIGGGGQNLTFSGQQFEPDYHTIENMTTQTTGTETKVYTEGGARSRKLDQYGISTRTGKEIEEAPN